MVYVNQDHGYRPCKAKCGKWIFPHEHKDYCSPKCRQNATAARKRLREREARMDDGGRGTQT